MIRTKVWFLHNGKVKKATLLSINRTVHGTNNYFLKRWRKQYVTTDIFFTKDNGLRNIPLEQLMRDYRRVRKEIEERLYNLIFDALRANYSVEECEQIAKELSIKIADAGFRQYRSYVVETEDKNEQNKTK